MSLISQTELIDLGAVLRLIGDRARVLTGATGVAIALPHKQSMICRASVGPNAPSLGSRLDMTSGFSAECIRTGKALCCYDSETDPRVDHASCRQLGIRSILAVPIQLEDEIIGLLEAFSSQPFAFQDRHVSAVAALIDVALRTTGLLQRIPGPKPLIQAEPASDINAYDTQVVTPQACVTANELPAQFWSDVLISSAVPWNRFAQSLALHVLMLAALAGFSRLMPATAYAVQPALTQADLLYYSPAEYFGRTREQALAMTVNRHRPDSPELNILKVAKEQRGWRQATTRAPEIKLKGNLRVLSLMPMSPMLPTIPTSAVVRSQLITPTAVVSAIAPPPEISGLGRRRAAATGLGSVVPPPPDASAMSRSRAVGGQFATATSLGSVVPPAPDASAMSRSRALGNQFATGASLGSVVPPAPDASAMSRSRAVGGQFATATSLGSVVPPAPDASAMGRSRAVGGQFATGDSVGSVIPPAPELSAAASPRAVAGTIGDVVGPPPSVHGSIRHSANLNIGQMEVVRPAPNIGGHQQNSNLAAVQASLRDGLMSVVAPPPSVQGVGSARNQTNGQITAGALQVVPPPPQIAPMDDSRTPAASRTETTIVPPPPATEIANEESVNSLRAANSGMLPLALPPQPPATIGGTRAIPSPRPAIPVPSDPHTSTRQQVSVTPIAPEVALASSSYFASSEIFVAEERLGAQRSRYIKLVYEYLPYQKRLSEYGPNYPQVDKLRVTRDVACDETLNEGSLPLSTGGQSNRSALDTQDLAQQQTLPCFRTTADDYRQALAHRRK